MKTEEYFGQGEEYFSESAHEFISITEMVPQYALNAFRKLALDYGEEFVGTPLCKALLVKVVPDIDELREVMKQHGKAVIFTGKGGMAVHTARARMRAAGADVTKKNGEWVEGYPPLPKVKVRAKK